MDNEVYAEKYAEGAEKSDLVGKLKQANDARWVEGHTGKYTGGGVMVAPDSEALMGAIGFGSEWYPFSWLSSRLAFEGIASSGHSEFLYGGLDVGVRAQPPSRLAPFVGAGAMAGLSAFDMFAHVILDEEHEDEVDWDGMGAVYPEVGIHLWTNGRYRVTMFGRYLITTAGRRYDGWLVGGQLARF